MIQKAKSLTSQDYLNNRTVKNNAEKDRFSFAEEKKNDEEIYVQNKIRPKLKRTEIRLQNGESVSDLLSKLSELKSENTNLEIRSLSDLKLEFPELRESSKKKDKKVRYTHKPSLLANTVFFLTSCFYFKF